MAENLTGVASEVRIVRLPGLREKGDVTDWLEAGNDPGQLLKLCLAAELYGKAPERSGVEGALIKSSAQFVAGFVPPDYLVDGLLQRRFVYSFTGLTNAGKTNFTLRLAICVDQGRPLGSMPVEKGRVLYLAGENPDDVRMRWIALGEHVGFDLETSHVFFIPGVFGIEAMKERITQEVEDLGGVALVVIDTSAAYFTVCGKDENDNVEMGKWGRMLRSLTELPGGPCVIANCHPTQKAQRDNLLPRGGGAFINEMDGNLTCKGTEERVSTVHWQGKFRGPDFPAITFQMDTVTVEALKDSKGRLIPTVIARLISDKEEQDAAMKTRNDEDDVLIYLHQRGNIIRPSLRSHRPLAGSSSPVSQSGSRQSHGPNARSTSS